MRLVLSEKLRGGNGGDQSWNGGSEIGSIHPTIQEFEVVYYDSNQTRIVSQSGRMIGREVSDSPGIASTHYGITITEDEVFSVAVEGFALGYFGWDMLGAFL
jgi:hypothetical protein